MQHINAHNFCTQVYAKGVNVTLVLELDKSHTNIKLIHHARNNNILQAIKTGQQHFDRHNIELLFMENNRRT